MFGNMTLGFDKMPGIWKIVELPRNRNEQVNAGNRGGTLSKQDYTNTLNYSFVYLDENYKLPKKIYGDVTEKVTYIWNTFAAPNGRAGVLCTGKKGQGKEMRNSTDIRVPDGWKKIGDIQVGDKVMAVDGSYTDVIGVYPQGKKDVYKMVFEDGRVAYPGAEHLWSVMDGKQNILEARTINTLEIMEELKRRKRLYIPLCKPELNSDKEYVIPPYIFGVIMSKGYLSGGRIRLQRLTKDQFEAISQQLDPDYEIINLYEEDDDKISCSYIKSKTSTDRYLDELKDLDLIGYRSIKRTIPTKYLNGSKEQRWKLVQGLMDMIGNTGSFKYNHYVRTTNKPTTGSIWLMTFDKEVAYAFRELIYSLGGKVTLQTKSVPPKRSGEEYIRGKSKRMFKEKTRYRLTIYITNPIRCFTRASKLLDLKDMEFKLEDRLRIVSITKQKQEECTCIAVNHPLHLYVCEDYIVTHNTIFCKALCNLAIEKGLRVFVISEIKVDRPLINFISHLDNCAIFVDEFYKVVGWQYQDDFLSLMSDTNKKRLFILSENDKHNINRFILDRPERIRYHFEFETLDPNIIREYCRDRDVPEEFMLSLLKINMSNPTFCFDHLHTMVSEAKRSGRWDIEWLIGMLNIKSLKTKIIRKPIKLAYEKYPDIYLNLEPNPISNDLAVVRIGEVQLRNSYPVYKQLKNNEQTNPTALEVYNKSREEIENFDIKMEILEAIEEASGNLDLDGLLADGRSPRRPMFGNDTNEPPINNPINVCKVNFASEFMVGVEDNYDIYVDVTGMFKIYIENKKLAF